MARLDFKRYGINDLSVYKNVIGIDLGHGEISASYMKLGIVQNLYFAQYNGKPKIYSGVFIKNNGTKVIGYSNDLMFDPDKGKLYLGFKTKPSRLLNNELYENSDKTKKELIEILMFEVVEALKKYNPGELEGNNLVFVGCPSSREWLDNEMDVKYANILKSKLGSGFDIVIMPESRASLIKSYKEKNGNGGGIGQCLDLSVGVIVFDFGSSTLDATIIDFIRMKSYDESIPLGASYIENLMLGSFFDSQHTATLLLNPEVAKLDLRNAKEAYYTCPDTRIRCGVEFKNGDYPNKVLDAVLMNNLVDRSEVSYSTDVDGEVTGTWTGLCEEFYGKIRHLWLNKTNESDYKGYIILTGGGSNMKFTEDLCRKVFPNATVVRDSEPSYCVSKGLVWAGSTDLEAARLLEEVKKVIEQSIKDSFPNLEEKLGLSLAPIIYDFLLPEVKNWVDNGKDTSLEQLISRAQTKFKQDTRINASIQNVLEKDFASYLNSRTDQRCLKLIINSVVNRFFSEKYPNAIRSIPDFKINDAKWIEMQNNILKKMQIDITKVIEDIDLYSSFKIAIGIVLGLLTVVIAIVSFGLIDLTDFVDPLFEGKKKEILVDSERAKIYNKLLENKMKIQSNLAASLKKNILSSGDKDNITKAIMENIAPDVDNAIDMISLYF